MARSGKVKPVIGIVGGVGAGKSTVAAELERLGCERIDADAIGHELLAQDDVKRELRRRWGEDIFSPDGSVNRRALAERVFSRSSELEALNSIMHGRIRRRMQRRIAATRQNPGIPAVVIDAALLIEAGWDDLCTDLIFVDSPEAQRQRNVASARGWDQATWKAREESQICLDKKASRCDYRVDNSSSVFYLHEQIRRIFNQIVPVAE